MIKINIKKSNKCNGEYSLFISFPYNQDIINIMRNQIIRYWIPETKEWEVPLKYYEDLINDLENYKIDIVDSHKILSNFNFNSRNNKLYT